MELTPIYCCISNTINTAAVPHGMLAGYGLGWARETESRGDEAKR